MMSDDNAKQYPVLYVRLYKITVVPEADLRSQAWHGSPLKNWHSVGDQ
jgi:hypothetical protein